MVAIQQVIVPVDFNKHSDTLAEFALSFAHKWDAQLTFIHVMKQLPNYKDYDSHILSKLEINILIHAQKKMFDFMGKIKSCGRDCAGEVLTGVAVDAIIAYAQDKAADLIIISTHGSQGIKKVLLGSVADRVIKGAPCPTLVFNPYMGERENETCSPMSTCIQAV